MKLEKLLRVALFCVVVMTLILFVGCGDRLPSATPRDTIDSGIDPGKPRLDAAATFNIFSELVPNGDIVFDTDTKLDVWENNGSLITNVTDTGYGGDAWLFTQGSWLGIGVRFAEGSDLKDKRRVDMSDYTNGYLNFMYKGTRWVRIGIGSITVGGVESTAFLYPVNLSNFGMRQSGDWCTIKVPLSHFSNLVWTEIFMPFSVFCNNANGGASGAEFLFDEVFYSKE